MLAERGVFKNTLLLRTLLLIVGQQFSSYRRIKSIDGGEGGYSIQYTDRYLGQDAILISALMNVVILLKITFKMYYWKIRLLIQNSLII